MRDGARLRGLGVGVGGEHRFAMAIGQRDERVAQLEHTRPRAAR